MKKVRQKHLIMKKPRLLRKKKIDLHTQLEIAEYAKQIKNVSKAGRDCKVGRRDVQRRWLQYLDEWTSFKIAQVFM